MLLPGFGALLLLPWLPPGRELLLPGFGALLLLPWLPPGRELLLLGRELLLELGRDAFPRVDELLTLRLPLLLFLPRASNCGEANAPHINAIDTILQILFIIVKF